MKSSANYQFVTSTLSEVQIKQITESGQIIGKLLEKAEFIDKIKEIFVCVPSMNIPKHKHAINFMLEFKDSRIEDQFDIEFSLQKEIRQILSNTYVNVYSRENKTETMQSNLICDAERQHTKAMLYAGIPIKDFNCQTNQELNDTFHKNFTEWQRRQETELLEAINVLKDDQSTEIDSPLRKQLQMEEFMKLPEDEIKKALLEFFPNLIPEVLEKVKESAQPTVSPSPAQGQSGQHQGRQISTNLI